MEKSFIALRATYLSYTQKQNDRCSLFTIYIKSSRNRFVTVFRVN